MYFSMQVCITFSLYKHIANLSKSVRIYRNR